MTKRTNAYKNALITFSCIVILLITMPVYAAMPANNNDIEHLLQNLAKVKSSKARFIETKNLSLLDDKITLSGIIEYIAPDTLIKKTIKPNNEFFKVSGDRLNLVKADGKEYELLLSNYPVIAVFTEAYRSVLAGNLRTLEEFYDVSFKSQASSWTIKLVPFDEEALEYIETIQLNGTGNHIRTVTTTESGGDKTIMQIKDDKQVF